MANRCGSTERNLLLKNKTGGFSSARSDKSANSLNRNLHSLFRSHVDAGELDRIAAGSALHGDMMTGVRRHFVLVVEGVDFLVRVVDENILCAMFFDALGGALAGFGVSALDAALAVGNPAGPAAIGGHGHSCGKQGRCGDGCKSKFHLSPSRKLLR